MRIIGQVVNEGGRPVSGVNIYDKSRTNIGTATDQDGRYTLNNISSDVTLTFSMIGYVNQDVRVGSRSVIDITLVEDAAMMETVVVELGYGRTISQASTTNAATVINPEVIADLPMADLSSAIRGLVPGVNVSGGMRQPGTTANITIRSPWDQSKDGGTLSPLYVIDDIVQVNPSNGHPDPTAFNTLDPSEIESITILRDDGAAIYGARSGQGVVLVRTKRGTSGAPRITYSGLYGLNDAAAGHAKVQNAYDYGLWFNTFNGPNGRDRIGTGSDARRSFQVDELEAMKNLNYNWLDEAWRSGYTMRHTLNVSGGNDRATYNAGVTYYTQDGNIGKLDYDQWTYNVSTTVKLTSNLQASMRISANQRSTTEAFNKIAGESDEADYENLLRMPKYIPWEVNGMYTTVPLTPESYPTANQSNPTSQNFFQMMNSDAKATNEASSYNVNLNLQYNVPFIEGMMFKGTYSTSHSTTASYQSGKNYTLTRPTLLGGTGSHLYNEDAVYVDNTITRNGNRFLWDHDLGKSSQLNFIAGYDRMFGLHNVSAAYIFERSETSTETLRLLKENPLDVNNGQSNTAIGTMDGTKAKSEGGTMSYVGRLSYSYDNRYIFDFVLRSDASTKFAPDNYWGTFYTASAAWLISEEHFFRDRDRMMWLDFAKIRFSYGRSGRDNTKPWQWRQRYTYQANKGVVFGTGTASDVGFGLRMDATPNADAHWDTIHKWNLGLDFGMLRNRLSFTFDGWFDRNVEMLKARIQQAPVTIGGSLADENWARADSYGLEMSVNWNDRIGRDFKYSVGLNSAWSDNRIRDFGVVGELTNPWDNGNYPGTSTDKGTWGYDCIGMFRTREDIDRYFDETGIDTYFNLTREKVQPGMLMFRNIRGERDESGNYKTGADDKKVDSYDRIQLSKKNSNPYGFNLNLRMSWKGVELNTQLSASWGGFSEVESAARTQSTSSTSIFRSQAIFWNDMFDIDRNPNGRYPNQAHDLNRNSSTFWQIPSFRMTIPRLSLSYTIPKSVTSRINVSNCRVILSCTNLAQLYNPYKDYNRYRSVYSSLNAYPTLRTMSLGVNLTL